LQIQNQCENATADYLLANQRVCNDRGCYRYFTIEDKPRYLMGVGTPTILENIVCVLICLIAKMPPRKCKNGMYL
jgi:queuine/archaeosine tRNA-ribosyltransferase